MGSHLTPLFIKPHSVSPPQVDPFPSPQRSAVWEAQEAYVTDLEAQGGRQGRAWVEDPLNPAVNTQQTGELTDDWNHRRDESNFLLTSFQGRR